MANGTHRSGMRSGLIGVLGFGGGFLACFGLGYGQEVLLVTGIALFGAAVLLYLFGSRVVSGLRRPSRQWLPAVGRVVEVLTEPPPDARYGRCTLSLELVSAGFTGVTTTTTVARVPVARWPQPGQEIAVQVADDNPHRVRVVWPDISGGEPTAAWTAPPAEPVSEPLADSVIDFDIDNPPTQPLEPVASAATTATTATAATAAGGRRKPRPYPHPRPPEAPTTTVPEARPVPDVAIHSVGITVLVSDLDRSVGFYRDRLGFQELERSEDAAVLVSGEARLVLRQAGTPRSRTTIRPLYLNLEVADLDAVYDELTAAGVRFSYPPRAVSQTGQLEQWEAELRDPDGHAVTIIQWRPAAAEAPTA